MSCANKHVGVPSCRARPAQPPRRAQPDPTRLWCVRVLDSTNKNTWGSMCSTIRRICFYGPHRARVCKLVGSKTRTYHGRVGTGRHTAAGRGRTGRPRAGSPRRQTSFLPFILEHLKHRTHLSWTTIRKHEQTKPDDSKTRTYHGRVGTGRSTAGRRTTAGRGRAGRDADGSVRQGNNRPSYPPDDRRQPSWAFLWKREQRKPYVNLSNPKPGHTTGAARRGRAGRDADGSIRPGEQPSLLPSGAFEDNVLNDLSEARTMEILCKPMEEQNQRLTRG